MLPGVTSLVEEAREEGAPAANFSVENLVDSGLELYPSQKRSYEKACDNISRGASVGMLFRKVLRVRVDKPDDEYGVSVVTREDFKNAVAVVEDQTEGGIVVPLPVLYTLGGLKVPEGDIALDQIEGTLKKALHYYGHDEGYLGSFEGAVRNLAGELWHVSGGQDLESDSEHPEILYAFKDYLRSSDKCDNMKFSHGLAVSKINVNTSTFDNEYNIIHPVLSEQFGCGVSEKAKTGGIRVDFSPGGMNSPERGLMRGTVVKEAFADMEKFRELLENEQVGGEGISEDTLILGMTNPLMSQFAVKFAGFKILYPEDSDLVARLAEEQRKYPRKPQSTKVVVATTVGDLRKTMDSLSELFRKRASAHLN
jgi:hypothetical protein